MLKDISLYVVPLRRKHYQRHENKEKIYRCMFITLNHSRMNFGRLSLDEIIFDLWFVFRAIKVMRENF